MWCELEDPLMACCRVRKYCGVSDFDRNIRFRFGGSYADDAEDAADRLDASLALRLMVVAVDALRIATAATAASGGGVGGSTPALLILRTTVRDRVGVGKRLRELLDTEDDRSSSWSSCSRALALAYSFGSCVIGKTYGELGITGFTIRVSSAGARRSLGSSLRP